MINKILAFSKQSIFYALLGICIIILGIYVGNMLFGKMSLEVLLDLKQEKFSLSYDIQNLQKQNAKLQKDLLELKALEPK